MEDENTHRRFCRWRDKGVWEALLEMFVKEPDMEWLMIDASHSKVHPHASGAKGGAQYLLADRGYDANCIIDYAEELNMNIVIPPKKNRIIQRKYDKDLYKIRHIAK